MFRCVDEVVGGVGAERDLQRVPFVADHQHLGGSERAGRLADAQPDGSAADDRDRLPFDPARPMNGVERHTKAIGDRRGVEGH